MNDTSSHVTATTLIPLKHKMRFIVIMVLLLQHIYLNYSIPVPEWSGTTLKNHHNCRIEIFNWVMDKDNKEDDGISY